MIAAVLDKFTKIVGQELVFNLLDGLRTEYGQLFELSRVKSPLDRVILRPFVIGARMLGGVWLCTPHLTEEVSIALASEAIQVLSIAVVSLEDFNHIGGIMRVLRDQVQYLLDVTL